MEKTIDNITYITIPSPFKVDRWRHPRDQCCTYCVGENDIPLCEKLQHCFKGQLIWVPKK